VEGVSFHCIFLVSKQKGSQVGRKMSQKVDIEKVF